MRVDLLKEPELDFGSGRHIDIRFGIMNYAPFDIGQSSARREIRVGIIGTPETVEGTRRWLERCRVEIPAKISNQPHLFPRFPGFNQDAGFYSKLLFQDNWERRISKREFELLDPANRDRFFTNAVQLFFDELAYIRDNRSVDVVLCAVPNEILLEPPKTTREATEQVDFRDLLKAKALTLNIPIQLVLPSTYDPSHRKYSQRFKNQPRSNQDEATRAWNLHTALYYKAGGLPWRLVRQSSQLDTCYVGISFFRSRDRQKIETSMAQVFNERGDGVIVKGGPAKYSKEDRKPYLDDQAAYQLLSTALDMYRSEHRNHPARVVLHKTSRYHAEEAQGFKQAVSEKGIELFDFLSFGDTNARLFRVGAYPPLRGTLLQLDSKRHILYTKGSVDFFATYPGLYVPNPLELHVLESGQTSIFLSEEILALTKMNWNNTQFDGGEPITIRAARQVGSILKYVGEGERINPRYSFYM